MYISQDIVLYITSYILAESLVPVYQVVVLVAV